MKLRLLQDEVKLSIMQHSLVYSLTTLLQYHGTDISKCHNIAYNWCKF